MTYGLGTFFRFSFGKGRLPFNSQKNLMMMKKMPLAAMRQNNRQELRCTLSRGNSIPSSLRLQGKAWRGGWRIGDSGPVLPGQLLIYLAMRSMAWWAERSAPSCQPTRWER